MFKTYQQDSFVVPYKKSHLYESQSKIRSATAPSVVGHKHRVRIVDLCPSSRYRDSTYSPLLESPK